MSGVWEMLNAVKKRRAEAEVVARQQGLDEVARKRAQQFFDHMLTNIVEARVFPISSDDESEHSNNSSDDSEACPVDDATNLLFQFNRYCEDTPELNQLVRTYTVVARDEPLKQLAAVNRMLRDATNAIDSANSSLKKGDRITKGLAALK